MQYRTASIRCGSRYPAVGGQIGGQLVAVASHLAGGLMAPILEFCQLVHPDFVVEIEADAVVGER